MILQGQAIGIPRFGKLPNLIERQNFSAFEIVPFTPFIDQLLRPEEQHGSSGKDQVIVPAGEGDGEVDS